MENYPKPQDHKENPPPQTPNSGAAASSPPPTARPGADAVPYPTTFVQAEPSTFKQVVQMLTGSSDTAAAAAAAASPKHPPAAAAAKGAPGPKRPAFKLYERRSSTLKSLKVLSPLMPAFVFSNPCSSSSPSFSPRGAAEVLSPSVLDLPSLVLSPVTPLLPDPFARPTPPPPGTEAAEAAEERAIAEKGFYLHPSPRAGLPPRLLPLFPVTSPRLAPASSSASASAPA
ncbi:VQ motif-containing protein 4-like [Ananas comosus]|uniref:VQ motif-containing protein 4-like n=1 Tax=Ananas comosus TaxID=4615 RepID=A0A6P5EWS9_ANACO|nr:VQ motif-containing protein 4-like [Ananas comosus]